MKQHVDLLLYNGIIYTANNENSIIDAIAVKDGTIIFAGSNQEAAAYRSDAADVIDLEGKMVLPGFIDSHLHAPGRTLTDLFNISLYEARSEEAISETIAGFISANPDLDIYYGEGFSIGAFSGDEVSRGPRKERLDRICAEKPVVLYSADCHLAWLNSRAFEVFGITDQTDQPKGGVIEKDPVSGELWGTLKESAMRLVPEQEFSASQFETGLREFQHYLHSLGYTGIASISIASAPPLAAFHALEEKGELKLHVSSSVTIDPDLDLAGQFDQLQQMRLSYSSELHQVNTAKFFADGVVEGATAYLLEPYNPSAGKPAEYRGEFLWDPEKLQSAFQLANQAGIQVHVHSIGDASTKLVLDALEQVKAPEQLGDDGCRNTITHLQLVDPADIDRFKTLQVIACVQPYWHSKEPGWWSTVDCHMLGERAEAEYPLQSFIRAGVTVASSSDHPVTPVPNPLRAIRAGVTRNVTAEESYGLPPISSIDDPHGLLDRNERASLADMIRSLTISGAYAIFREKLTGSLEKGKRADLVIFDQNLFSMDPLKLEQARVLKTYFGGELVYDADQPGN
jgi:predicted amidohydrolase YtcJ